MTDTVQLTLRIARGSAHRPEWKAFKAWSRATGSSAQRNGFFFSEAATAETVQRLRALAEFGCNFYGHHTAGTTCNAATFYATDDRFVACDATNDGCPAIRVVIKGSKFAKMLKAEKTLRFANQLARMTVLIDNGWAPNNPPKKPRLTVV